MARPSRRSMKAELQERQSQESGTYRKTSSLFKNNLNNVKFFKCKEGGNLFDIIPYEVGDHDPISKKGSLAYVLRIFVHKSVSQTGEDIICLEQTFPGKKYKCPVCTEYRKRIAKGETPDDLKKLKYSRWPRTIYNVIDRKDTNAGIQIFHTSAWLFQQYLDVISKKTNINKKTSELESHVPFADLEEGRSIAFDRQGMDDKTKFIGVRFEDRDDPIPEDITEKSAHCLDDLIAFPTEEEAYEAFWGIEPGDKKEVAPETKTNKSDDIDDEKIWPKSEEKEKIIEKEECKEESKEEDDEEAEMEKKLAAMKAKKEAAKKAEKEKGNKKEETKNAGGTKCPHDHKFGVDIDEHKECEDCSEWKLCAKEQVKLESGK